MLLLALRALRAVLLLALRALLALGRSDELACAAALERLFTDGMQQRRHREQTELLEGAERDH